MATEGIQYLARRVGALFWVFFFLQRTDLLLKMVVSNDWKVQYIDMSVGEGDLWEESKVVKRV